MHISDLINEKLGDPVGNLVAAALDSGITESQVEAAVALGIGHGFHEHEHPEEKSPGDKEPRYADQVTAAEKDEVFMDE